MYDSMVIMYFSYNKIFMEVYSDLVYLPLGPFINSFSTTVYDFTVSSANSVINPLIILSNQKSTMHVNLLLTCYNYTISIGCHYSYLI
jgi:hypothetical protein